MPDEQKAKISELLSGKYKGFHPALACKWLKEQEGIMVSDEFVRRLLQAQTDSKERAVQHHPLRRRRGRFGELVQIDGSPHAWFGEEFPKCTLLVFVDDATGKITAARFFESETAAGYLTLIYEHVRKYGVPLAFYSDRHSIFQPTQESAGGSKPTQFQRACNMLGIESILAQSPQAKGRVERLNQTLQKRWPKEFKLLSITNIEQANARIEEFIEDINETFSVPAYDPEDAHTALKGPEDLKCVKRICAIWSERTLSKNLTCSYGNRMVQVHAGRNKNSYVGKTVNIVDYQDGRIDVLCGKKLLPFVLADKKGLEEHTSYEAPETKEETAKTVDKAVDKVMEAQKQRRQNWLNQRAEKARKALQAREWTLEAAEELIEELAQERKSKVSAAKSDHPTKKKEEYKKGSP